MRDWFDYGPYDGFDYLGYYPEDRYLAELEEADLRFEQARELEAELEGVIL